MFVPTSSQRALIAGLGLAALLGVLFVRDVFATTVLQCQRRGGGTRCTISEQQLGLSRRTLVIADLSGAYVEDEGYDREEPRLVLQGKGREVPLDASAAWTSGRRHEAAAALVRFASEGGPALRFDEHHPFGRALAALGALAALLLIASPRLRPTPRDSSGGQEPDEEPRAEVAEGAPKVQHDWFKLLVGAVLLRRAAYRELAAAPASTLPALVVVVMVALIVGYADGLDGSMLDFNGRAVASGVANANLRAIAAAAAACVSWPAAAVLSSWLAAGRGGVRTLELLRALGFANVFHLLSLLRFGGVLAWPMFFLAAYVATRSASSAGRVRSLFATCVGQWFALFLAVPLWIAVLSIGSD